MEKRINVNQLEPKSYKPLLKMEEYIKDSEIDYLLREMIKIRASQINKCAYCLDMHIKDALTAGASSQKLNVLAAWQESPLFSEAERAALALTEEITLISDGGLSQSTYEEVLKHFTENQVAQLIIIVCQINSWNRIAVSTHMLHPID